MREMNIQFIQVYQSRDRRALELSPDVGKTLHGIKFIDYNKLVFKEQHFRSNSHNFCCDEKFTNREELKKYWTILQRE